MKSYTKKYDLSPRRVRQLWERLDFLFRRKTRHPAFNSRIITLQDLCSWLALEYVFMWNWPEDLRLAYVAAVMELGGWRDDTRWRMVGEDVVIRIGDDDITRDYYMLRYPAMIKESNVAEPEMTL